MLFGAAPLQGVDAHAPLRTSGPARLPSASTEGIASPGVLGRLMRYGTRLKLIANLQCSRIVSLPNPLLDCARVMASFMDGLEVT